MTAPSDPVAGALALTALHLGDRPLRTRMLADMLRSLGGTIVSCSGLEAAAQKAEQQAFDIIYVDTQSTGFDPAAACRRLRSIEVAGRRATPVIALVTAGGRRLDGQTIDAAVAWPASLHELMRTTLQALELSR